MPDLSDELPDEKKKLLARWIAQGAEGSSGDGGFIRQDGGTDASASGP
jgi:hypothetical protein